VPTCGVAAVVRRRRPALALLMALFWAPASLIVLIVVSVLTYNASGI
jgi:hypothetical protein